MAETLVIPVHVQPRGSCSGILGVRDGRLRVKTTAPPADGRANDDVARQLADAFDVPPSRVQLKSGGTGRRKTFVVRDPRRAPPWLADLQFS